VFKINRYKFLSRKYDIIEKNVQTKVVGFKKSICWSHQFDLRRHQGQVKVISIFFNGAPYFCFQNLITDVESFPKRYKKIFFHEVLFELWCLKITVSSILTLPKVFDRWLKPFKWYSKSCPGYYLSKSKSLKGCISYHF